MHGIRQITGTGSSGMAIALRLHIKQKLSCRAHYPTLLLFSTLKGYIEYERSLKKPIYSVSSGRSSWLMLLVAIAAVHRPGAIGLEGNFTCLSALCASGIVHLCWAAVVAAPVSASVSLHLDSLTFGIDSMNRSYYKNDPTNWLFAVSRG